MTEIRTLLVMGWTLARRGPGKNQRKHKSDIAIGAGISHFSLAGMTLHLSRHECLAIILTLSTAVVLAFHLGSRTRHCPADDLRAKNMKSILIALRMFSSGEGGGNYPKELDELEKAGYFKHVPRFESQDGAQVEFIYIPGFLYADEDKYVILVAPELTKEGYRWIGTIRGDVIITSDEDAQDRINLSKKHLKEFAGGLPP